jgi:NodT family efflux transporter outer membrane factor (OMF) lipoprotein
VKAWHAILVAGALSGCLLGPNYTRPSVAVPSSYASAPGQTLAQPIAPAWWTLFADPTLTGLEEQALGDNQDLQASLARVAESRAVSRIAESQFYPVATLDPSFTSARLSPNRPSVGSATVKAEHVKDIVIPFDLSYELDLWGKIRRSVEASTDTALATELDAAVVSLTLSADVALQYFTLRSLDAQNSVLDGAVQVFRDELNVVEIRYHSGIVSELDVAQAETQLRAAEAQQADVQRQRSDTEHALAVLCGRPAPEFNIASASIALAPPDVPAGVPSQLLERRPDVAGAEATLAAANAQIGVADALFFPSLEIVATGGLESATSANLLDWESRFYSIGPSASLPIFEGGRLVANRDAALAAYDAQTAAFRQVVLSAFREVEDALTDVRQRRVQREALDHAVDSARNAVKVARIQYVAGIVDYLSVVVTEQARLNLELQQAQVAQQQLIASALLVKALGGGWQ